ncbi:MAG TPA: hypothetical protein VG406_21780, partial [Isosphaeraceae bacterium]|nr:hypothetical protein [Isosphaeraceae bacterium]
QEAEDRALLDTSPEGEKRYRYEGQAVRHLHKVIDQYCKGRQGWFEPKVGARRRSAPNEPTAEVLMEMAVATVAAGATPVATDPHPRGEGEPSSSLSSGERAGVRVSSDPDPAPAPNEPTAEVVNSPRVASNAPARGETREAGAAPVASSPHPSPLQGGEGGDSDLAPAAKDPAAPNEPTAEIVHKQGLPTSHPDVGGTIRRESFTEPPRPLPPLVINGIWVR